MSDTKLRDLERRWKETGAVEDEAAYLLERVRVGDLSRERLELAAYCGHEGARATVGVPHAAPPASSEALVRDIGMRWGSYPCVLAAWVAVTSLEPKWKQSPSGRESMSTTAMWLQCPCVRHSEAAAQVNLGIEAGDIGTEAIFPVMATYRLVEAVAAAESREKAIALATEALRDVLRGHANEEYWNVRSETEVELVNAMTSYLANWALTPLPL